MWILIFVALFLSTAAVSLDHDDCATNLRTLEEALYESKSNLFELNRVFYPPSVPTTRVVRVNYTFGDELDACSNVSYIWAVGEFLFLQPPTLFQYTSLFFYYPNYELTTLSIQLPIECIWLINGTDGECSCKNGSHMLNILTQQVRHQLTTATDTLNYLEYC
jgi:hypothetical protein